MKNLIVILLACVGILGSTVAAQGADEPLPGVLLTLANTSAAEGVPSRESRVSRTIALYVPADAPAGSALSPQPFKATFEGNLNLRLRTYVKFHAEGRGRFKLTVNGAAVFDASGDDLSNVVSGEVRLNKGKNILFAEYASPAKGDAEVRLFWESKTFAPEPLPTALLTHEVPSPETAASIDALQAQSLMAQYRCLKCHTAFAASAAQPLPEFNRDAPDLADAGSRFQVDWLAAWIADPHKLRPGAHMPAVLHGTDATQSAADIAAYLMSIGKPPAASKSAGDAIAGGRLFANLECVVCHTPPGADEDVARISLRFVAAKFQPAALQQYLLDPAAHYAWNPMPRFALSETEAADLAAYFAAGGEGAQKSVAGDAGRGKTQFVSAGCANCHPGAEKPASGKLLDLSTSAVNSGCLADSPDAKAPQFAFTSDQRQVIAASIKDQIRYTQRCDTELAEAAMHELRCIACHSRDATESLLTQSLAEVSQALHQQFPNPALGAGELLAAEQRIPSLTFAGEKLRPAWVEQFIGGKLNYKPRYFLRARMPAFGAWGGTLAKGMAEQHGVSPSLPDLPQPKVDLIEAGRALCGKTANMGFSCNQCHPIGTVAPFAPFEAPSINFEYVAERLRPQYYNRWMHDPARIDVATKMPKFADADNKTGLAAFDHDAGKQFDAMWQYLLTGRKIQPPQ